MFRQIKSISFWFSDYKKKKDEIFKKNQGSLANKIFLLKWGISIKTFKKHYLKSNYIHNEDLSNPNKNLYYYLDILKDYISSYIIKSFRHYNNEYFILLSISYKFER